MKEPIGSRRVETDGRLAVSVGVARAGEVEERAEILRPKPEKGRWSRRHVTGLDRNDKGSPSSCSSFAKQIATSKTKRSADCANPPCERGKF